MKKVISLIMLVVLVLMCFAGCSSANKKYTDDEIVKKVKISTIEGFSNKEIGTTMDDYFAVYDREWNVVHPKGSDVYTVEYQLENTETELEIPLKGTEESIRFLSLNICFDYNVKTDKIEDVTINGVIYPGGDSSKFYSTDNLEESKPILCTIFGEPIDSSSVNKSNQKQNKKKNKKENEEEGASGTVENSREEDEKEIKDTVEAFYDDMYSLDFADAKRYVIAGSSARTTISNAEKEINKVINEVADSSFDYSESDLNRIKEKMKQIIGAALTRNSYNVKSIKIYDDVADVVVNVSSIDLNIDWEDPSNLGLNTDELCEEYLISKDISEEDIELMNEYEIEQLQVSLFIYIFDNMIQAIKKSNDFSYTHITEYCTLVYDGTTWSIKTTDIDLLDQ